MTTIARNTKRRKWEIDFSNRSKDRQIAQVEVRPETVNPLGYVDTRNFQEATGARDANSDLIEKKSWDVALGPMKQIPMNLFIMWMAGNTISIFPIMMVGMMFVRPIQAFMSIQQTFKSIDGTHATLQRAVYTLGNCAGVVLAVYKCQVMGLLPTHPSDWLAFVQPQERMEWSGGGLSL